MPFHCNLPPPSSSLSLPPPLPDSATSVSCPPTCTPSVVLPHIFLRSPILHPTPAGLLCTPQPKQNKQICLNEHVLTPQVPAAPWGLQGSRLAPGRTIRAVSTGHAVGGEGTPQAQQIVRDYGLAVLKAQYCAERGRYLVGVDAEAVAEGGVLDYDVDEQVQEADRHTAARGTESVPDRTDTDTDRQRERSKERSARTHTHQQQPECCAIALHAEDCFFSFSFAFLSFFLGRERGRGAVHSATDAGEEGVRLGHDKRRHEE
eukprot:158306-Rhodomonas_salina.4